MWRTQQELDRLRQEARTRLATNAYARGLLANLVNNVVGKGGTYTVRALDVTGDGVPDDERLKPVVRAAQRVVDKFLRRNRWNATVDPLADLCDIEGTKERMLLRTVKTDGEALVRFFFRDNGDTDARVIDVAQLRDPPGGSYPDGWSFGKRHEIEPHEDVTRTLEFSLYYPDPTIPADDPQLYEIVPAKEMLHLKGPDTPATVKRGISPFLFDTGGALDRAAKLQAYSSHSAAVRAATAETWQYPDATQAQVDSMATALPGTRQERDPSTGRMITVEKKRPGTVRHGPVGAVLVPPSPDNTPAYMSGVQGDLQQALAAECAPAFWAGDTGAVNYNNAESAAAPAVRAGECEQEYYRTAFAAAAWKALLWAAECGVGGIPRNIAELVSIDVELPAVRHRNELETAQEAQIGIQAGWTSRQIEAARRGNDPEKVFADNEEYAERFGQGGGLPMPGDDGSMPGMPQAPGAALESLVSRLSLLEAEWDESKHKRADDGKFGSGGASGGKGDSPGVEAARKRLADRHAERRAAALDRHKQREYSRAMRGAARRVLAVAEDLPIPAGTPFGEGRLEHPLTARVAQTAEFAATPSIPLKVRVDAWRQIAREAFAEMNRRAADDAERGAFRKLGNAAQDAAARLAQADAEHQAPERLPDDLERRHAEQEDRERARLEKRAGDRKATRPAREAAEEGGFTGIDSHGHKWVSGKQVKRTDLDKGDSSGKGKAEKPKNKETPTHHPGAAHGSEVRVKPTKTMAAPRNAKGQIDPVATKTVLSKQETGRVAEATIRAYLRDIVGITDTVGLNAGKPNESIDLFGDSMAPEVKGGMCNVSKGAQQWRITFSMELGQKEQAAYNAMSEDQQKAWREKKQRDCLKRKTELLKKISKKLGRDIKAVTFTGIVNPDTKTVDIYRTEGYHQRVGWNDSKAKYQGSVAYDHA